MDEEALHSASSNEWAFCNLCPYRTKDKFLLGKHMPRHGGSGKLKCAHCCYACNSANIMTKHTALHNINSTLQHSIQSSMPTTPSSLVPLDLSVKTSDQTSGYGSSLKLNSPQELVRHQQASYTSKSAQRGTSGGGKFPCKFCSFAHDDVRIVLTHIKVHENILPVAGISNAKVPDTATGVKMDSMQTSAKPISHEPIVSVGSSGKPKWECPECPFMTRKGKAHFDDHIKHHTNSYSYRCTYCTYSSPQYNYLALHIKTHQKKSLTNNNVNITKQTRVSTNSKNSSTPELTGGASTTSLAGISVSSQLADTSASSQLFNLPAADASVNTSSNVLDLDSQGQTDRHSHESLCEDRSAAVPDSTTLDTGRSDEVSADTGSAPASNIDYYRAHDGSCYICTHCGVRLASLDIQNHVLHHTVRETHQCDQCSYSARMRHNINVHKRFHKTQSGKFHCPKCSFVCNEQKGIDLHSMIHAATATDAMVERDGVDELEETGGSALMVNREEESKTSSVHSTAMYYYDSASEAYKCRQCPQLFSSREHMTYHIAYHTKCGRYQCQDCTYSCDNDDWLKRHRVVHTVKYAASTGGNVWASLDVPLVSNGEASTSAQPQLFLKPSVYRCSMCPYEARSKERRESHMQHHGGPGMFACEECNYRCSAKAALTKHHTLHSSRSRGELSMVMGKRKYWGSDNDSPTLVSKKRSNRGEWDNRVETMGHFTSTSNSTQSLIEQRLREIDSEVERTMAAASEEISSKCNRALVTDVVPTGDHAVTSGLSNTNMEPATTGDLSSANDKTIPILKCTECRTTFRALSDMVAHVKAHHAKMFTKDEVEKISDLVRLAG